MSWAYWAPKSTTRTRSCSASPVARDMSAAYPRGSQAPTSDSPGTRLGRAPDRAPDLPGRAPGPGRSGSEAGPRVRTAGAVPGMGRAKGGSSTTRPDPSTTGAGAGYGPEAMVDRSADGDDRQAQCARCGLRHHRMGRGHRGDGRVRRTQGRPRVGLVLVRPVRHRPLRLGGDRQRRVHAEVRRDRRAIGDVEARVAVDPLVAVDDAGLG